MTTTYLLIASLMLGATYLLYVFYAAVMNIQRVRDAGQLTLLGKVFGYPTLLIGLLLDIFVNVTLMTIIMVELPRELTVTSRLKRHNVESKGWRLKVVKLFEPVLDPLDPSGEHI